MQPPPATNAITATDAPPATNATDATTTDAPPATTALPTQPVTTIALASDHAGFEQRQQLADWLRAQGFQVRDLGPATGKRVDYPDFATLVAKAVARGEARFGVLVCGTGIGMAIAANKTAGIRAANITTPQFAALAREHNDANVITLSARFVELETNKQVLTTFFSTSFAGGRHVSRLEKITALE